MATVVKDEADKKREELRHRHRVLGDPDSSPTKVIGGDKNYYYRGVYNDKQGRRISHFVSRKGYEFVPKEDPANFVGAIASDKKQFGDQVLMRIPRDLYEANVEKIRQKNARRAGEILEADTEEMERLARNSRAVGPHRKATFDVEEER